MPSERTTAEDRKLGRRGRPRAGEGPSRREAMLDAALAELVEKGYERATMLGIATRAGASKETLYSWFNNKEGLIRSLIEREVTNSAQQVSAALRNVSVPRGNLIACAVALLRRATADGSVAIKRAAITSTELGPVSLRLEQEQIDPVIEEYISRLSSLGPYLVADAGAAHRLFRSLVGSELQLKVLLGLVSPSAGELTVQATTAVDLFLSLITVDAKNDQPPPKTCVQ